MSVKSLVSQLPRCDCMARGKDRHKDEAWLVER